MRIYLVGYMGSGKSTLGRTLAKALGIDSVDLDDEFENRYKIAIPDFLNKYGENAFRDLEHKIMEEISIRPDIVVSTGGGSPCYYDNMLIMNQTGLTVYLKARPELLISRIEQSTRKRPLYLQMTGENYLQRVERHLDSREPFYQQSKITIDAVNPDVLGLKAKVLEYFNDITLK